jgi:hypothetical protein
MEELRVSKLLAGGLAAISGAVVASRIGVEGTLTGAALTSIFVAVATALYSHSLVLAQGRLRRVLVRKADSEADTGEADTGEADTGEPGAQPIRWQRVAVAAAVVFVIAVGAITAVEAIAGQPLASLFGNRSRPGASTSIGVVASGQRGSTPPATQAPGTPTTSLPTTTAPVGGPTTTLLSATTAPSTTAVTATTPGTQVPTTQRR